MTKRGVILAGGFGTRMSPATNSTNKHLLPVYTHKGAFPMIEYPIRTLQSMDCEEILIITSKEHCGAIVEYLGDGYERDVNFTYKIQEMNDIDRPAGIASALKLCEDFTKNDPFVVILGDNYYQSNKLFKESYDKFIEKYNESKLRHDNYAMVFLNETNEWERFGIADIFENEVTRIVEKPKKYIGNMAVTGMYLYGPDVYRVAETLKPSNRGELEITDINNHYIERASLMHLCFNTFWSDMGTPESMKKTINFLENKN
jgi:glucose-1-phosphate thymidylyltransferase